MMRFEKRSAVPTIFNKAQRNGSAGMFERRQIIQCAVNSSEQVCLRLCFVQKMNAKVLQ